MKIAKKQKDGRYSSSEEEESCSSPPEKLTKVLQFPQGIPVLQQGVTNQKL